MTFLNASMISRLSVELLVRSLILPRTVSRLEGRELSAPAGGRVTIRVPIPRDAQIQSTPGDLIDYADIDEDEAELEVVHLYDAARITDEDLSLSVESFARQVLRPQVAAVATGGEAELADAINDVPADLELPEDPENLSDAEWAAVFEDRVLEAGEILDDQDVPVDGRTFAMSPSVARRAGRLDKFTRADARGDGGSALSSASLGLLHGFNFVKSSGLTGGQAAAYHRSAFGFAGLAPTQPAGAAYSAVATEQGISVRHIRQYNPSRLSEESVVSLFAGATLIDADRVVKLDTDDGE